ncbi:MAG: FHA domain-containing protein, partial [bacterium]
LYRYLVVISGKAAQQNYKLDKAEMYIGRDTECDVVVTDWLLGKRHAKLIRTGKNYTITDLNTWKGTKVNGVPIKSDHLLFHKDLIEIGSTQLQFLISDLDEELIPGVPLTGPTELSSEFNVTLPEIEAEAGIKLAPIQAGPRVMSGEYVASAISPIFHFIDCNWAKGIAERNRVYFKTVGDAILSRRRSCHTCKPGMQDKDIEFWLNMLHDKDESVRRHAAANLKKLTGKDYSKEKEL